MAFETIIATPAGRSLQLKINRPQQRNSINSTLITELGLALDEAERNPECRVVILSGGPGLFCTGMDFAQASASPGTDPAEAIGMGAYMNLLKRFTLSPKVIVACVDGKVIAGGVGLVAASDLAICTARSEFSLSEALWGLLPCCVIPFLIRRVGFQKAYTMALTTRPIPAPEALASHLVDELADNTDEALRKLSLRLNLLAEETILDLKRYFREMWLITPEMESLAVNEIGRLTALPRVQANISNYVRHRTFPWEKSPEPKRS